MNHSSPASSVSSAPRSTALLSRPDPLQELPPAVPGPSRLHHVHNREGMVPPIALPSFAVPSMQGLIGAPAAQFERLSQMLAAGPITLDLLHTMLAAEVAGTSLARLLGDHLAARCALPATMPAAEQQAWRDVLLHALRLPALQWEVAVLDLRRNLSHAQAQAHPLLAALRDALYRPQDMARDAWRALLAAEPLEDSLVLALEHQQKALLKSDMQARDEWAASQLQTLAPLTDGPHVRTALRAMRQREQLEHGLLDARVGLQHLLEHNAASVSTIESGSPLAAAAGIAPVVNGDTSPAACALGTLMVQTARSATWANEPPVTPIGRFDSVVHALTSALYSPLNLMHVSQAMAAWGQRVTVETCTPAPAEVPVDTHTEAVILWRKVVDGLTRHTPALPASDSTALMPCIPQTRHVAGLHVEQAAQIVDFIHGQQPDAASTKQALDVFAHLFGRAGATAAEPVTPATANVTALPASLAMQGRLPLARAGALTDQGQAPVSTLTAPALLPGAGAQFFGQMAGPVPLLLMQGLIDHVPNRSWWRAIPGYTAHSAQGLLQSITDLFAQGGEHLHGRPPSAEALERFFGTEQGIALFDAINQLPELSTWQEYEIERGGVEAQIYVFMRMLKQLMRNVHAQADSHSDPVHTQQEHDAHYLLARIGLAAGALLEAYDDKAPDAGRTFFRRVMEKTRPSALHSPTPVNATAIKAHAGQLTPTRHSFCPPIKETELRQWWVDVAAPLLGEEGFLVLTDAARCLAQIAVVHSRTLYGDARPPWRTTTSDMSEWRELADRRARSGKQVLTWEGSLGLLFHRTAGMLHDWMLLQQDRPLTRNELNLGIHLRHLVEPLQQLYSQLELPLHDADPWYAESLGHFLAFYHRVGNQFCDPDGPGLSPNTPAPTLSLAQWLERQSGHALAQAICPADALSLRDGLANAIQRALISSNTAAGRPLDAWTLIVNGPHLLQQWLDSAEGHTAVVRWVDAVKDSTVHSGAVDKREHEGWQVHAEILRKAVLSQLPPSVRQKIVTLLEVPTLFAGGAAPVLTLAQALAETDPLLLREPEQALLLALALLPVEVPTDASRMSLTFPLWPQPSAHAPTTNSSGLLLERWFQRPSPAPLAPTPLDTSALPDLHTLLQRWGLDVLHNADPDAALPSAELWDLMSRTQGFAELGQQLLRQTDWGDANEDRPSSPQGAQMMVAQALLERYVGHPQIEALRAELQDPKHVHRTFVEWQAHVAALLAKRHPHAPAAARDLLQWLLLSEVQQPALLVRNIPEGLSPASLAGSAFLHSIALLEALQPGASGRVSYVQVAGLAAALSAPSSQPGAHDALHASWARAMLQPALLYAVAHGQLPGLMRLDQVTPAQASSALDYLKKAQDAHAAHLALIAQTPPTRRKIAEQKLKETGLDPALWSLPVDKIGTLVLGAHGITVGTTLQQQEDVLTLVIPEATSSLDGSVKALLSVSDSLLDLIAADAYLCTGRSTTQQRFDDAFAMYRAAVEQGLAGLIETLLQSLPPEDQAVLRTSLCTPLQVHAFDQDATQGLLLRCQPDGNTEPVYFEILPRAGLIRRAVVDPHLGPCVDAQGLIDGSIAIHRADRLAAVSDLRLTPLAGTMRLNDPDAMHALAAAAAKPLWDARLDEVKKLELSHLTPLEQVLDKEEALLKKVAEFTIPFFACGEDLVNGEKGKAALDCGVDVLSNLIPGAKFAGSMVRIAAEAGTHTVVSAAAHTGEALGKLAAELLRNSGAGLIHDLGKGALRLGGQAWEQALRGAGWLRGVLGGERALGAAAHAVEAEVAVGTVTQELLTSIELDFEIEDATLAVGQVDAGPMTLMVSGPDGWYRFDPIAGAAYGPPLQRVSLVHPLPEFIPGEVVEDSVRLQLGDATDARFIEHGDNQWEVWIGDSPYLLNPGSGSLQLREVHGGEIGELQELDVTGCRVPRGVESVETEAVAAGCVRPTQLRFVPDRLVPLPESPTSNELLPHAFGYRSYSPADMKPLNGFTLPGGKTQKPVMVHDGKLQKWDSRTSPQGRVMPPKLEPLTPEEEQALGVPEQVKYLSQLEGKLVPDSLLGLDKDISPFDRMRVNRKVPVVHLGPIAEGVQDSRELRGVHMLVDGKPSICIEPDRGVYYVAPVPDYSGDTLHFVPLTNPDDIAMYLRQSERNRLLRENPQSVQVQRNIAEMTFNYLRPGFEPHELELYDSYEKYVTYCEANGKPNEVKQFAQRVFSGGPEQKEFVSLSRLLIPDWKALQTCSREELRHVADMLNTLLPVKGKEAEWVPLTADSLMLPETAQQLIKHVSGANFAYAEVKTTKGTMVIGSLSGGKLARKLNLNLPESTAGTRYVDARDAGVPENPVFATLPVLRTPEGRAIVFDRGGDSENWIFRYLLSLLDSKDPAVRLLASDILEVKLVSFLNTCSSCGGVVLPTVMQELAKRGSKPKASVRYLLEYEK